MAMGMGAGKGVSGAMIGGGLAAAAVFGAMLWWAFGPKPTPPEVPAAAPVALLAPQPQPVAEPAPAPAAEPAPPAPPAAEVAAPPEPAPAAAAEAEPAFDALRVSPEGEITLAGRVEPGAQVEVLLDGQVIDTVAANAQGAFASVVLQEPSAEARALSLRVTGADGVAREAAESLTVAPSPLALAEAATAAGAGAAEVAEQVEAAQVLAEKPLLTDASGAVQVLAGPAEALVIDALAFEPDGRIAISGRGAPQGALLRAYLDNAEAGLVQAGAGGAWSMALPAAGAGPHVVRVDALDATGKVLARAEQEFIGMAPPAPKAAPEPAAAPAPELAAAPEPVAPAPAAEASAAAEAPVPAAEPAPEPAAAPKTRLVTIERGNTLWAIARDTYGDPYLYVRLFEANREQIRNPDLIYPGQVFTLPE